MNPKEVTETIGTEAVAGPAFALFQGQGEGGTKELLVAALVGFPYPAVAVEVFSEIDQDVGKLTKRIAVQTLCVVGEVTLCLRQGPPELAHNSAKMQVALSLVSLGSVCRVAHGSSAPRRIGTRAS